MPDALETLLDLVVGTCGDDMALGYAGAENMTPPGWYIFAYWYDRRSATQNPDAEGWEIEITNAETLRAALCACIAHPRFGQ